MPAQKPLEALTLTRLPTPIGEALVVTDAEAKVRAFDWADHEPRMRRLVARYNAGSVLEEGPAPDAVRSALNAYFQGDFAAFDSLDLETGGTEFQCACWAALTEIPAGETRSYGQQAVVIGKPKAVRAVGLANGANPIGLIIPCHRVIGADGSLTGFSGGLPTKRFLLELEGALPRQTPPPDLFAT